MKMIKWFILFVGVFFLVSCQKEASYTNHQGYIASIDNNRILVGDIYFSIEKARLETDTGKFLRVSDLRVGMEVSIYFNGMVAESLPGQAGANKVIIKTHEDSIKAEEAVRAIIQFAEKQYGKPILIQNSKFLDDSHFYLEIKVFSEESPVRIQYDYNTKNISLE